MKTFKDKVAVVTGAASGIGRGMVENFVEAGMKAVLADIEEESLKKTTNSFKERGFDVIGVTTDVSKQDQVEDLAQKTIDSYGSVHVLCNNAGVSYTDRYMWEIPNEAWEWVLNVNLFGVINGIRAFMPIMLKQNTECNIVNTSSLAGLLCDSRNPLYGVSKHGVVILTEALYGQLELFESKVKVSVLCPGNINTDILNSMERNRPGNIPPPQELTEEEALFREAYFLWLERGMDPKEVGRQVLKAIKEDNLYIITHDWNHYIEQRMKDILGRTNPVPREPPEDLVKIMEELMSNL